MSLLSQAIVALKRPYFALKMMDRSWNRLNHEARHHWQNHPVALSDVQTHIVAELRQYGIALTTTAELFPHKPSMLSGLQECVENMRASVAVNRKKSFLLDFFGSHRVLDLDHPFSRYALEPEILDTVNAYLRQWSRFYYFYLGETLPVPNAEPVGSQRWHRDPEDKRMCKVFIYLTDVDSVEAGPFTYLKGSQEYGDYRAYFPQKFPQGSYPALGAVEKIADPKDIFTCLGKAGTIIFCDTSGLHRGGLSTSISRTMFTAGFSSFASHFKHMYELPEGVDMKHLPLQVQYALHR